MLAPVAVQLAPEWALVEAARPIQPNMPAIRAALEGLRDSDDVGSSR
ncbi:MAG TPA: hypothetical protein VN885_07540 [Candidatus Acidoferrales bacterium]|nr:hypothetical protein [Candidatus Acidoferrales bacterium]